MMNYKLLIVLLITQVNVFAGTGMAFLSCVSESGRTILEMKINDISSLEKAVLVIDGDSLIFGAKHERAIVFDDNINVFTIFLEGTDENGKFKFLEFRADPSSFNKIIDETHNIHYEFDAFIRAKEPRKGKGFSTPDIKLKCIMKYKI